MNTAEDALKERYFDWPTIPETQRQFFRDGYEAGQRSGYIQARDAKAALERARQLQEQAEREADALRAERVARNEEIGRLRVIAAGVVRTLRELRLGWRTSPEWFRESEPTDFAPAGQMEWNTDSENGASQALEYAADLIDAALAQGVTESDA